VDTDVPRNTGDLEVWKFGGASLADAEAIQKAARLIARHPGPLVVVASALGGVTDLLLEGASRATDVKGADAGRIAAAVLRRHRDVARAILPAGARRRRLLASIDRAVREYHELCVAVGVLGHVEFRASDLLVSRGERLSAAILAEAVSREMRRATYLDALDIVRTDGQHGGAAPQLAETTRHARRLVRR
jgi:aspartokinase